MVWTDAKRLEAINMEATTSDPTLDVALVLRSAILQAPAGGQVPICPFFDDRVLPLDCLPHELPQAAPSLRRICQVLETIAAVGDVEEACLVGALMQLEKVLQLSDTILCAHNWRLLVFIR